MRARTFRGILDRVTMLIARALKICTKYVSFQYFSLVLGRIFWAFMQKKQILITKVVINYHEA
jgi:hypothetical protein